MDIISNITNLADTKGVSQTFICDKLEKKRNYLFNLKKQNKEPSDDQMVIIANVLGTTVEYLKGETDDPAPAKEKSPSELDELLSDPLNKELFDKLAKLSAAKKKALLALIEDQETD